MNYAKALKSIREEQKITQVVAAKRAGISQTYLSQLEGNTKKCPSKSMIAKLAKVYKVPPVIITMSAIEKADVPTKKKGLYDALKPVIDSMIKMVVTGEVK